MWKLDRLVHPDDQIPRNVAVSIIARVIDPSVERAEWLRFLDKDEPINFDNCPSIIRTDNVPALVIIIP